jgi:hypothetical protein
MCLWVVAQFGLSEFFPVMMNNILTRKRLLEAGGKVHCVEGRICHPMEKGNQWKIG